MRQRKEIKEKLRNRMLFWMYLYTFRGYFRSNNWLFGEDEYLQQWISFKWRKKAERFISVMEGRKKLLFYENVNYFDWTMIRPSPIQFFKHVLDMLYNKHIVFLQKIHRKNCFKVLLVRTRGALQKKTPYWMTPTNWKLKYNSYKTLKVQMKFSNHTKTPQKQNFWILVFFSSFSL